MNIFLCCLQSKKKYNIPAYHFWRENFKPALEKMGHTVIEPELDLALPLLKGLDSEWLGITRPQVSQTLYDQVYKAHKKNGIDLFFSYFYNVHVESETILKISKMGIPTVNFFCDNARDFYSVSEIVNAFTLNWVPEKQACQLYEQSKAPFIHLPMAADPDFYQSQQNKAGHHLQLKE